MWLFHAARNSLGLTSSSRSTERSLAGPSLRSPLEMRQPHCQPNSRLPSRTNCELWKLLPAWVDFQSSPWLWRIQWHSGQRRLEPVEVPDPEQHAASFSIVGGLISQRTTPVPRPSPSAIVTRFSPGIGHSSPNFDPHMTIVALAAGSPISLGRLSSAFTRKTAQFGGIQSKPSESIRHDRTSSMFRLRGGNQVDASSIFSILGHCRVHGGSIRAVQPR